MVSEPIFSSRFRRSCQLVHLVAIVHVPNPGEWPATADRDGEAGNRRADNNDFGLTDMVDNLSAVDAVDVIVVLCDIRKTKCCKNSSVIPFG